MDRHPRDKDATDLELAIAAARYPIREVHFSGEITAGGLEITDDGNRVSHELKQLAFCSPGTGIAILTGKQRAYVDKGATHGATLQAPHSVQNLVTRRKKVPFPKKQTALAVNFRGLAEPSSIKTLSATRTTQTGDVPRRECSRCRQ